MTTKLMKIKDLILEEKYYPRLSTNWRTVYGYAQAMKTGAKFPPITVGMFKGKPYVIDGWHRIGANKSNKQENIMAEILTFTKEDDLFLEAAKRNATHGKQYSFQEKINIANRLKDMKIDKVEVSKLVCIPVDTLPKLIERKTITMPNGKKVVLKAPLDKVKDKIEESDMDIDERQSVMSGYGVTSTVDQLILILEVEAFKLNKELRAKLSRLKILIDEVEDKAIMEDETVIKERKELKERKKKERGILQERKKLQKKINRIDASIS